MTENLYYAPAEWQPHQACWLAWPSHAELWCEALPKAQAEFTALCRAIADVDPVTKQARGEALEILVPDDSAHFTAQAALSGLPVRFHEVPFGDIWLRDTAPIFLKGLKSAGGLRAARFEFNGWGGKYVLPGDAELSDRVATIAQAQLKSSTKAYSWVLEGGSLEMDGAGTCLTTRQCLLNPNRNPGFSERELETNLKTALGLERILWLGDGLLNDHTDGHIDTIARFAREGVVLCMQADPLAPEADPNHLVYEQIARDLAAMTDARGRKLEVVRIPSPGSVFDEEGRLMPASYLNFYIANTTVVVPTYGGPADSAAVAAIAGLFPGRKTVGLSARAILEGGGAFHCITQQVPV